MDNEEFLKYPTDRLLVFRFSGGPRDAEEQRSDEITRGLQYNGEAKSLWLFTKGAVVGSTFVSTSPGHAARHNQMYIGVDDAGLKSVGSSAQPHVYKIVDKRESPTEILVELEYQGLYESPPTPGDMDMPIHTLSQSEVFKRSLAVAEVAALEGCEAVENGLEPCPLLSDNPDDWCLSCQAKKALHEHSDG